MARCWASPTLSCFFLRKRAIRSPLIRTRFLISPFSYPESSFQRRLQPYDREHLRPLTPPTGPVRRPITSGTYARVVREQIIDGERWIADRLRFLRGKLAGDLPADDRRAIEAEIAVLSKERGITLGGLRGTAVGRRLRRKA